LGSGVVLAAIPRLEERHEVSRLGFNGPRVVFLLRLPKDKAEGGTEALDREGCDFDPFKRDAAKLSQTLLIDLPTPVVVHRGSWPELVDPRLDQRTGGIAMHAIPRAGQPEEIGEAPPTWPRTRRRS
jgi:hypothetical protein